MYNQTKTFCQSSMRRTHKNAIESVKRAIRSNLIFMYYALRLYNISTTKMLERRISNNLYGYVWMQRNAICPRFSAQATNANRIKIRICNKEPAQYYFFQLERFLVRMFSLFLSLSFSQDFRFVSMWNLHQTRSYTRKYGSKSLK